MLKKHIFSGLTVLMLGFMPLVANAPAYAATNTVPTRTNFFQGLVTFLEQKFGLDKGQVTAAVNDYRNQQKQTMQQNMQNREKSRLDTLVSQGKITSSQEQAILDELAKLKQGYSADSLKNLTPQQRKDQFQKEQQELQDWAKSQGIDPTLILPGNRMKGKMMIHRGWFGGPTTTPTPTQ